MKKIIIAMLAMLLTSSLMAADKTAKAKLASDMRIMLSSVVDIQRAGFYDNKDAMKDATKKLISSLDSLLTTDPTTYLPVSKIKAVKFARKREKMIKMYAEDLMDSMEANDMDEALEDYAQILRQCSSCHSRLR
jgi:hypothetical protein